MTARIVGTEAAFDQLQPDWDRLCEESRLRAPFYSWLWQSLWWRHFGNDKRLFTVVVEDDGGGVIGIVPLMKQRRTVRGLPVRELTFASNGITPQSAILVDSRRLPRWSLMRRFDASPRITVSGTWRRLRTWTLPCHLSRRFRNSAASAACR